MNAADHYREELQARGQRHTRKVSTYRLEVQAKPDVDTDALLTSMKAALNLPLAGSGLGAQGSLSILFRAESDYMALAQWQELVIVRDRRDLIAATVLSIGQGVNYREVDTEL